MRKIKNIIYILLFIAFSSCDFLEVEPVGKTTIPQLFSTIEGIRAALPGTYSALYDYYENQFTKYPDVAGDMLRLNIVGSGTDMIDQYNYTSDGSQEVGAVGYIWKNIYIALANANNIIQYQPALLSKYPKNTNELQRIKGEALFIRALCHFDLCRVYAQPYNYTSNGSHLGVPTLYKTPGADENVSRASINTVYDMIIKDLKDSESLLENNSRDDYYHVTVDGVRALLSRVYLYREDWDNCIKYSNVLINKFQLAKGQAYLNMYNKNGDIGESIFRLNGSLKSSKLAKFYSITDPIAYPEDTLISLFDPQDIRLELLAPNQGSNKHLIRKYNITTEIDEKSKHWDPIIIRVSEIYLNRAEAYWHKNEIANSSADLKCIVSRALDREDVTIESDKEMLYKRILTERNKELCFEGHRLFDIVRTKNDLNRYSQTNSSLKFLKYPNDRFVLPIPDKELEANTNMQPNPTVNN